MKGIGRAVLEDENTQNTFDVGNINIELSKFFTCFLYTLINRLQDFLRVLFYPSLEQKDKCVSLQEFITNLTCFHK